MDLGAGALAGDRAARRALALALVLYARVPFARFFRTVWFTPVLMSYPVVGVIWLWVYNYDWGIANLVLRAVGLGAYAQAWLASPSTALPALILGGSAPSCRCHSCRRDRRWRRQWRTSGGRSLASTRSA